MVAINFKQFVGPFEVLDKVFIQTGSKIFGEYRNSCLVAILCCKSGNIFLN